MEKWDRGWAEVVMWWRCTLHH